MRLIDADAFAEEMKKRQDACKEWTQRTIDTGDEENYLRSCGAYVVFVEAKLLLEKQPTIDAVEVKHGEWIHGREIGKEWNCGYWITYFEDWHCSNCGVVFEQESKPKYHFCPNCGAKMDVTDINVGNTDGERRES